jgi:hypothetical protein
MQVRFEALFRRLVREGAILSSDQFKKLSGTDGLWEFKRSAVRILACRKPDEVVLLLIFTKSTRKLPQREGAKASKICRDDLGGHP